MDVYRQEAFSVVEKWFSKPTSGTQGKKPEYKASSESSAVPMEERPERIGVGAKLSSKAKRKREEQDKMASVMRKNLRRSSGGKDVKGPGKMGKGGSKFGPQALHPLAKEDDGSSEEEESRTTIGLAKKSKH